MTFLQRATGPALATWPVCVLVVVWSAVLSLLGSGSTASGSLGLRAAIALLGGMAACGVVLLAWWLILSRLTSRARIPAGLIVIALAGVVRGLVVQVGFVALGFSEATPAGFVARIVPSIFTISFAFLVGAAGVSTVIAYRATAGRLLAEQRRLVALLDASAMGIEERQSDALERVQRRLDAELRTLAQEANPSAITSLESLAGDVVRPLSHSLARELPEWESVVPEQAPRVSWVDVLRDPEPSAAIRPLVLPGALLVIALPAAALVYAPINGMATVVVGMAVLVGVLTLGRLWLVRRPPRRPALVWLAVVLILVVSAIATNRSARLAEGGDPSSGSIPSLALFVVPVFGLIIATVSMMGARMRSITAELESTTSQLQWNLARLNTQQWEQSGRLSRALHGPVQSMLHARLLRLRKDLDAGEASSLDLEDLRRDLQEALASALAPAEPRPVADVLADVAATWQGVAHVECEVTAAATAGLARDPLCTRAVTDLATEAVSNAVRHGGATTVRVSIDVDDGELITVRVVDDGSVPESGPPGLGTALLTRCSYDWALSKNAPTTLTARLPCTTTDVAVASSA